MITIVTSSIISNREDLLNQMAVPVRDDAATCFTPDSGKKWHFDLPGLVSAQLRAAGVSA